MCARSEVFRPALLDLSVSAALRAGAACGVSLHQLLLLLALLALLVYWLVCVRCSSGASFPPGPRCVPLYGPLNWSTPRLASRLTSSSTSTVHSPHHRTRRLEASPHVPRVERAHWQRRGRLEDVARRTRHCRAQHVLRDPRGVHRQRVGRRVHRPTSQRVLEAQQPIRKRYACLRCCFTFEQPIAVIAPDK